MEPPVKPEIGEQFAKRQRSGILSPKGGIIVAMGWSRTASAGRAACEGVASERSETRSPKPLDYSKEI